MNGILLRYSSCRIEEKKRELMQYSIVIYLFQRKAQEVVLKVVDIQC